MYTYLGRIRRVPLLEIQAGVDPADVLILADQVELSDMSLSEGLPYGVTLSKQ
jgi:hypothetical protein